MTACGMDSATARAMTASVRNDGLRHGFRDCARHDGLRRGLRDCAPNDGLRRGLRDCARKDSFQRALRDLLATSAMGALPASQQTRMRGANRAGLMFFQQMITDRACKQLRRPPAMHT